MNRVVIALVLAALVGRAHADEPTAYLPADAILVGKVRPVAVLGILRRAGKWSALVRDAAHLPQTMDPLDPSVLATTGMDPAADSWASVTTWKKQAVLRLVLALAKPESAPIATGMLALALGKLDTSVPGVSSVSTAEQTVVVRSQGSALVVDVAFPDPGAKPPLAKELVRAIPVRPPRAFVAHGTARRFDPSDAIALWVDFASLARWSLRMSAASPKCAAALRAPGTFDDFFATVQLRGPDAARVELALGSSAKKLAAFASGAPVRPHRAVVPEGDATIALTLGDVGPLQRVLRPMPAATVAKLKASGELDSNACANNGSATLVLVRRWPEILAQTFADDTKTQHEEAAALRALADLHGGAFWSTQKTGEDMFTSGGVAFVEIGDTARGDLDRLLSGVFSPTTPMRLVDRQLTTYAAPSSLPWFGAGALLVLEPLNEGGTIVGLGARERLREAHQSGVRAADGKVPPYFAHLALSSQLVRAAAANLRVTGVELAPLVDGIGKIEAELVRDADAVRLTADIAITSRP